MHSRNFRRVGSPRRTRVPSGKRDGCTFRNPGANSRFRLAVPGPNSSLHAENAARRRVSPSDAAVRCSRRGGGEQTFESGAQSDQVSKDRPCRGHRHQRRTADVKATRVAGVTRGLGGKGVRRTVGSRGTGRDAWPNSLMNEGSTKSRSHFVGFCQNWFQSKDENDET